jgi:hypothetical protein
MSKCPTCGKKFPRPQGLGAHLRYNHKKKAAPAARNGSVARARPSRPRTVSKSIQVIHVQPPAGIAVEVRTLGYPAKNVKTFHVFGRSVQDVVTRVHKSLV